MFGLFKKADREAAAVPTRLLTPTPGSLVTVQSNNGDRSFRGDVWRVVAVNDISVQVKCVTDTSSWRRNPTILDRATYVFDDASHFDLSGAKAA